MSDYFISFAILFLPLATTAQTNPALLLGRWEVIRYSEQGVQVDKKQAALPQGELIVHRRAVRTLLRDPATDPQLAARLQRAQLARRFALQQLGLPDNRSYTGYVVLDRPYVVWNVFAAPRYSVEAVPQCFPVAGCVAYRGWFGEADAKADAARLQACGDDVWIGGVPAYSTLGRFADPILSSMLRWDDDELDGTIFHELAHQLVYVKGDTAFNESFATFVQTEGLRESRQSRGLPPGDGKAQAMGDGVSKWSFLQVPNPPATLKAIEQRGGEVRPGDAIRVVLPALPHEGLDRV